MNNEKKPRSLRQEARQVGRLLATEEALKHTTKLLEISREEYGEVCSDNVCLVSEVGDLKSRLDDLRLALGTVAGFFGWAVPIGCDLKALEQDLATGLRTLVSAREERDGLKEEIMKQRQQLEALQQRLSTYEPTEVQS